MGRTQTPHMVMGNGRVDTEACIVNLESIKIDVRR